MTVGLVGARPLPGTQARLPAAAAEAAPRPGARQRESTRGACSPGGAGGCSPAPPVPPAGLFPKSPSSRAGQARGEMRTVVSEGKGLQKATRTPGATSSSPDWGVQTPASHPTFGEEGPLLPPLPRRSRTTPGNRTPACRPLWGQQEAAAGRLTRGPQASPARNPFLTSSRRLGNRGAHPPGWLPGPPQPVQPGSLPSACGVCGGVTAGGGPAARGQERSGVSPTAGLGNRSQPISFHCL